MIKERSFFPYFLLVVSLLPVGFIIYFNTMGNTFLQNLDNSEESFILKNIENIIAKEFLKKKYRFTTFFSVDNQSFLDTQISYRNSYNSFKNTKKIFYQDINNKINYINEYYNKNNSLPAFWDNSSDFVFFPLKYVKYNLQPEFENQLKDIFKNNYEDINLKKESIKNSKILNYIYIDYKKKWQILVLISSPLDPDPLYPDNKRMILIINTQKDKSQLAKKYFRSLIINN